MRNGMRPIHPGEILREEFMGPMKITASALSRLLKVPANRVTLLMKEERDVTADTALRLARCFGTSAEFWMNLQATFDLRDEEKKHARKIAGEVTPLSEACAAN